MLLPETVPTVKWSVQGETSELDILSFFFGSGVGLLPCQELDRADNHLDAALHIPDTNIMLCHCHRYAWCELLVTNAHTSIQLVTQFLRAGKTFFRSAMWIILWQRCVFKSVQCCVFFSLLTRRRIRDMYIMRAISRVRCGVPSPKAVGNSA